jgi:biopolymer transport protein ExbD
LKQVRDCTATGCPVSHCNALRGLRSQLSAKFAWPNCWGAVLKSLLMSIARRKGWLLALVCSGLFAVACDDEKPQRNPFDPPPNAPKQPPPTTEVPKPEGPPELSLDAVGLKVGFTQIVPQKPEDFDKLHKEVQGVRDQFSGKDVHVKASRETKTEWVVKMLSELDQIGASALYVQTDTRKEYSGELEFQLEKKVANVPSCSLVAVVREDRGTAVWRLSGGTASKRSKGFAGPDLSMTGDTLERYYKGCKQSDTLFVSGAEGIQWGLVFDLAASAKKLEKASFPRLALLSEPPTAGRPVRLAH